MPMNYTRTALLLAVLTAIFVSLGALLGGYGGMLIAFVLALAMNVWSLWKSDSMVLRMHQAQEVDAQSGGQYYEIVRSLAERAGLPMPRIYVMQNPQPNAFATGRNPENQQSALRPDCSRCCRRRRSPASWRTSSPTSRTATHSP